MTTTLQTTSTSSSSSSLFSSSEQTDGSAINTSLHAHQSHHTISSSSSSEDVEEGDNFARTEHACPHCGRLFAVQQGVAGHMKGCPNRPPSPHTASRKRKRAQMVKTPATSSKRARIAVADNSTEDHNDVPLSARSVGNALREATTVHDDPSALTLWISMQKSDEDIKSALNAARAAKNRAITTARRFDNQTAHLRRIEDRIAFFRSKIGQSTRKREVVTGRHRICETEHIANTAAYELLKSRNEDEATFVKRQHTLCDVMKQIQCLDPEEATDLMFSLRINSLSAQIPTTPSANQSTCPICVSSFDQAEHSLGVLTCRHTACRTCLSKLDNCAYCRRPVDRSSILYPIYG